MKLINYFVYGTPINYNNNREGYYWPLFLDKNVADNLKNSSVHRVSKVNFVDNSTDFFILENKTNIDKNYNSIKLPNDANKWIDDSSKSNFKNNQLNNLTQYVLNENSSNNIYKINVEINNLRNTFKKRNKK